MKKIRIILTNVLIMTAMLGFLFGYVYVRRNELVRSQVEAFEDVTLALEQVTVNYLEGEQSIVNTWANYVDARKMTIEEAIEFVVTTRTKTGVCCHILYTDGETLTGLSSTGSTLNPDDNKVSYGKIDPFTDIENEFPAGEGVNITRAYTNPQNGTQSISFYNRIHLTDPATRKTRPAVILRVVPISILEQKWVFPKEDYQAAEISLIDGAGNYIIKGESLKNANFFEFYRSYNRADNAQMEKLRTEIATETGSFRMFNSRGEDCLVAHAPVNTSVNWSFVTYTRMDDLEKPTIDWLLISVVTIGLLALFLYDLSVMLFYNKKLIQTAKEAEKANRAKTDFLSTMSHDIRTPMNAIIGLTTIAAKNVDDRTVVTDSLRKIGQASDHLLTLINDILDISKVESGKVTLSPAAFSIVETAENLVNLSQPMVKEKNIDFNFRINGIDHEYLYADQLRLNQVFINILSNAIKYTMPEGKVSVNLSEEPGGSPDTVRLTYVVADTGIGMTPEFMEQMYKPFSRQTDSRVNSVQGTGLGLAITKKMVDLMNGTIDCESQPGVGTTFTVRLELPISDKGPEDMHLDPIDLLLVDDDEILLETTADTLRSLGVEPELSASAADAMERIRARHAEGRDYAVIILDWKMPETDGVELARRIRSEISSEIPILLISAYDYSDLEETAHEAGVNGFITKPLFRSTLYCRLSELMGKEVASTEVEDDASDLAGMNILVAEDNDMNWEIISMLLEMHGINCERAENGQLCVDRVISSKPGEFDLVFMDVQMPVMNGLDAARAIRALHMPEKKNIPIVAMTADAFSENVTECLNAGMNGHIAKPIDFRLVIKEIRKIKERNEHEA